MATPFRCRSRFKSCLLALVVCTFDACSPTLPNVVPVSGRVTLKGQPLAGATVTFQPAQASGDSRTSVGGSVGRTNAEGHYELRLVEPDMQGAVVGQHMVTI